MLGLFNWFLKDEPMEINPWTIYGGSDLPGDVFCNIAIYADDTTLYSNYDQASDR